VFDRGKTVIGVWNCMLMTNDGTIFFIQLFLLIFPEIQTNWFFIRFSILVWLFYFK